MDYTILNNDIAKEVLTIIYYSDKEIQDNIPDDVLKKLTILAADSNKDVYIEKDKSLNEQNLSKESLDYFSALYYLYVANSEEKDKILSSWIAND